MTVLGTLRNVPTIARIPRADRVKFAAIYRTAANRIERLGWIQMASKNQHGICAAQAIHEALAELEGAVHLGRNGTYVYLNDLGTNSMTLFSQYVGAQNVPEWNDQPQRTADEVTKTLRACADELAPERDEPTVDIGVPLIDPHEWYQHLAPPEQFIHGLGTG